MSFRTLLVMKAVVCLVFGPLLLFAPVWLFGLLGTTLGAGGAFAAREYGAALFGTLLLTWLARDTPVSSARKAILVALLVYDGIGFVITSMAVISHLLNPLAWAIAFVYLFFTVGPAYLLLRKGTAEPAAA
jgi:hypothetical protein